MFKFRILLFFFIAASLPVQSLAQTHSFIEVGSPDEPHARIEWNDGRVSTRYRLQENADSTTAHNALQAQVLFDVSILFFHDQVRIEFQGSTGSKFDSSWNNTGAGTGDPVADLFLRRLSLVLSPLSGLEVSVGSMAPEYGAGSENSYYDADGYLMAYQARVSLEASELVVTGGYVGDFKTPNVFDRLERLDDFNYLKVALTRSIGDLVRGSFEYNRIDAEDYLRGAIKLDLSRWAIFLDAITLEEMMRISPENFSYVVAAKLTRRFKEVFAGRDIKADLTYAYQDDHFDLPIGDKIFEGHSVRVKLAVPEIRRLGPGRISAFVDWVQSISDWDRLRAEAGLTYRF